MVDFSFEKYSGSAGHMKFLYQQRKLIRKAYQSIKSIRFRDHRSKEENQFFIHGWGLGLSVDKLIQSN